jgi:hypothetical protein
LRKLQCVNGKPSFSGLLVAAPAMTSIGMQANHKTPQAIVGVHPTASKSPGQPA